MIIKKKSFAYLVFLIITIVALLMIRNAIINSYSMQGVRDFEEIMATGELNVVTDYNSIGYFVSGDTAKGFQLEMVRALEAEWGVRVNLYLENSLDDNLKGLESFKYDIVARNVPVNSILKELFAFTSTITLNKLVLVQRKYLYNDSIEPIRNHLDLAKKVIHVAKDSPAILRLNNLSQEIGDTIFVEEDPTYEAEQLVMMVASGDIDFTVCDERVAKHLAAQFPEIDIETDISFTQLESWALRKESPVLLDSLNSWIARFKESKHFMQIHNRYYKD